jgi:hypothetical protein
MASGNSLNILRKFSKHKLYYYYYYYYHIIDYRTQAHLGGYTSSIHLQTSRPT